MYKKVILIISFIIILFLFSLLIFFKEKDTEPYLLNENCTIIEKDINKGMTIKDEFDNEWVWIVVPKSKVFKKAKHDYDYKNILEDILRYTKDYNQKDVLDSNEKFKNEVLSSIYKYGGFWISRYEIGTINVRGKNSKLDIPYSKKNLYVYNYVNFKQAKKLANEISNKKYKSSLLFGFQINLVFKFIEENGYNRDKQKIIKEMINSNSSSWGNYYSSSFIINRGKYSKNNGKEYSDVKKSFKKNSYNNYLLTTGASDDNKVCNIYDFAGNVSEWSLEKIVDDEKEWNIIRDGSFYFNYGGNDPASGRYKLASSSSNDSYGFRVMCIK